jgi:DNA polymerase III subunit alpha
MLIQTVLMFPAEYLTRTLEVAEKCNLKLDLSINHFPVFTTPDGSAPDAYLWKRIQEGIRQRYGGNVNQVYTDRLNKEYDIIKKKGFSSYFLIIDDMINHTKAQGIKFGPRGSVIASLVSYLLGITDIDPIEHDLLFERFLTEDRTSPPDIDIDFAYDRRNEVVDYLRNKYGYVAQIKTFNKLLPKSIVRNVGSALELEKQTIDELAKAIPLKREKNSDEEEKSLNELQSEIFELRYADPSLIDIGTRPHDVMRHSGKHPGGTVVSDKPISDIVPLCASKGNEMTQYDKDSVEASGLLKIDILGNRYLSVVDMAMGYIENIHGFRPDITDFNDPETYNLICSGDTSGIFQLGQKSIGDLVKDIQPQNFDEIVHVISLGRPGVLDSGVVDNYITSREIGEAQYLHPALESILKDTFGVIIYQEQIMLIAVEVAGLSWKEGEKFRKAVSKQKKDIMASMKDQFINGCISASNFPETIALALWDQIECFGGYGFNKCHAVGYAYLTYLTAYLKAHYPLEYYTALLSVKSDDEDEYKRYIYEAKKRGIKIVNPDINLSTDKCNIINDSIYLPLTFIKRIGAVACEAIILERSNGEFQSYDDFCKRIEKCKVNKTLRENLIKAGAFDSLEDRSKLLSADQEISDIELVVKESEVLGFYLSEILSSWYGGGTFYISDLVNLALGEEFVTIGIVDKVYEHTDKNGNLMAFVTIADNTGQLEGTIFASAYDCNLTERDFILTTAKLNDYDPLKAIAVDFSILYTPSFAQTK